MYIFIYWQEKMKGKNKLVPRLLGVTKESILRVDEKTKEVGPDSCRTEKSNAQKCWFCECGHCMQVCRDFLCGKLDILDAVQEY